MKSRRSSSSFFSAISEPLALIPDLLSPLDFLASLLSTYGGGLSSAQLDTTNQPRPKPHPRRTSINWPERKTR